ncbi:DNA repair protein RadC [candidate division TA06 bacterium]|nr:DNA repair protein RadC [candidate division TA06 bacterium]
MKRYPTKFRDMPRVDRPREKLKNHGVEVLTDTELLAILLSTGRKGESVLKVADRLLRRSGKKGLANVSLKELEEIPGVGLAKASKLIAAFELGRRLLLPPEEEEVLTSPKDVYKLAREIRKAKKEHFIVFYLNTRNRVIQKETISIGNLNASIVHPREVFEPALRDSAASVILVHNHPSGDTTPSDDDIQLTRRMVKAGEIMGIEVLDHLIIGEKGYVSLKDQGLM